MGVTQRFRGPWFALCAAVLVLCAGDAAFASTFVRFDTVMGTIDVELFDDATPQTVANFLNYVDDGDYENTFFHRSVPDFVIQGGGFVSRNPPSENLSLVNVPSDPPVVNEPGISNTRGTIAMAKLGGQPNSATNQWFFNTVDNPFLDGSNGGFTVFGQVIGNGMAVVDAMAAVQTFPFSSPFGEIPLRDYTTDDFNNAQPVLGENLVLVHNITRLTLLGDANNDGQVTGLDLISVQQNFGTQSQAPGNGNGQLIGDANDDGQVTGLDLIFVQQNFGNTLGGSAPVAVPEPATVGWLLLASALVLPRRRS